MSGKQNGNRFRSSPPIIFTLPLQMWRGPETHATARPRPFDNWLPLLQADGVELLLEGDSVLLLLEFELIDLFLHFRLEVGNLASLFGFLTFGDAWLRLAGRIVSPVPVASVVGADVSEWIRRCIARNNLMEGVQCFVKLCADEAGSAWAKAQEAMSMTSVVFMMLVLSWVVLKVGQTTMRSASATLLERNLVDSQINLSRNGFDLFSGQVGLAKPIPDFGDSFKTDSFVCKNKGF